MKFPNDEGLNWLSLITKQRLQHRTELHPIEFWPKKPHGNLQTTQSVVNTKGDSPQTDSTATRRGTVLKCWNIRKVENHCSSVFATERYSAS